MKQSIGVTLAAAAMMGVAGCRSGSGTSSTPTRVQYQYSTSNDNLLVVPQTSKVADIAKPDVSTAGNSLIVAGVVRLRSGAYNPDAVVRISIVDRRGNVVDEINAALRETDSLGTLAYRAHFGPVPAKGSSLVISYDDWHPVADYASNTLGSGGGGSPTAGNGVKGDAVYSNTGNNRNTGIKNNYGGGPTRQGARGPR